MNEKYKKLIESTNIQDFIIGIEFLYKEEGIKYFVDNTTRGNSLSFKGVDIKSSGLALIRFPEELILHKSGSLLWLGKYDAEKRNIYPGSTHYPNYLIVNI